MIANKFRSLSWKMVMFVEPMEPESIDRYIKDLEKGLEEVNNKEKQVLKELEWTKREVKAHRQTTTGSSIDRPGQGEDEEQELVIFYLHQSSLLSEMWAYDEQAMAELFPRFVFIDLTAPSVWSYATSFLTRLVQHRFEQPCSATQILIAIPSEDS